MKQNIVIISLLLATCSNHLLAQITRSGALSAVLPKQECEVKLKVTDIEITGNNAKNYTLIYKEVPFFAFGNYSFTFKKTDGRATATFTIFVDGVLHREWVFEGSIATGQQIINLNNMNGKTVTLIVKNHSATNKIEATCQGTINTNSMLLGPVKSNETVTTRITESFEQQLNMPCNGKGTIEVTRLAGTSTAEIVVTQGGNYSNIGQYRSGGTVIKVETMAANEQSKRINLNNINPNAGPLRMEIRNIQTGQFIRARIGAWFN